MMAFISRLRISPILLVGCILILQIAAPHARGGISSDAEKSEDAVPEGLTDSDWKNIRQEYERHRHAAVAVDGGFRARNPGQQWLTHFEDAASPSNPQLRAFSRTQRVGAGDFNCKATASPVTSATLAAKRT